MKLRYDLALFDLDGTLTNSSHGIMNGLRAGFRHVGMPVPGSGTLRRFIGPPLLNMLAELYPQMTRETAAEFVKAYRRYYARQGAFENEVYPGIPQLLAELRRSGRKLAVVTSKPTTPTRRILDHFGLTEKFDFISAADDSETGRGKEYLIRPALVHCGVPAGRTVMIGDTKYDASGARNAGTAFIGVLYGFGSREEMEREGAKFFTDSVESLSGSLVDKP